MEISNNIGGIDSMTIGFVAVTGITGYMISLAISVAGIITVVLALY